jgi:hypothetical protein
MGAFGWLVHPCGCNADIGLRREDAPLRQRCSYVNEVLALERGVNGPG